MIEILKRKYMAGTSTHQEEQELHRLLQETPSLTAEDQALLEMLEIGACEMEAEEDWLQEDETKLFDRLMEEQAKAEPAEEAIPQRSTLVLQLPPRRLQRIVIRLMATAAVICGAFFATRSMWLPENTDSAVTYIYGNKVENSEIAMDMMHETLGDIFDRPDVESELSNIFN